jgi:hypothetical protein
MGHQAGDEVNVAAEPVELGDRYGAALAPRFTESRRKLDPFDAHPALSSALHGVVASPMAWKDFSGLYVSCAAWA